ncbi:hypothetical protein L0Z36_26165 [Burkholderia multivorans]|uniref:hypothetical protein n=1 Tax=Burkholderia multivorans TaxID=87883 RepID=UPI002019E7CC|nr:hypothetical protein [Burkholderia multivorans]UQP02904.1 hypothetical protein L0Z36_26165 [Burkholderia multivorans]
MEPSSKPTSPYLQFLFSAEPAEFFVDTNLTLGDIFIALAYPSLYVEVGGQKIAIDGQQPDFHAEPDEYPLYAFLSLYPQLAEQIVRCHPVITALFQQYMEKQWDELTGSGDSQEFLDGEALRVRCIYCLPEPKKYK